MYITIAKTEDAVEVRSFADHNHALSYYESITTGLVEYKALLETDDEFVITLSHDASVIGGSVQLEETNE